MERPLIILAAVVLAINFVVVPLLGVRLASRRRALAEKRRTNRPEVEGYASILLSRLVVQTCRVLGLEKACLLVGGTGDPAHLTVVDAHGLDEDVIGRRVRVDRHLRGALRRAPAQRLDAGTSLRGLGAGPALVSGAVNPTHVLALCALGEQGWEPAERESTMLRRLTALCASALDSLAAKQRLDTELRMRTDELAQAFAATPAGGAPFRVDPASLAVEIGTRLRLDQGALVELDLAARLLPPGGGEPDEALGRVPGLEVVALLVGCVHERWDGRGPLGLPGDQIPLASRILSACNAVRVLTARRPDGDGRSIDEAVRHIQGESGTVFDPTVVTALTHVLIGELPELAQDALPASDWARADAQYAALL